MELEKQRLQAIADDADRQKRLQQQRIADELLAKMLKEEDLAREEKRRAKDEKENACNICYEPMFEEGGDPNDFYNLQNCGCVLHLSCIQPHLES